MRITTVKASDLKSGDLRAKSYVPKPLKAVVLKRTYFVDVTEDEMLRILHHDGVNLVAGQTLLQILQKLGAFNIEYDGMLGASVFFTLYTDDDNPAKRAEICAAVAKYCGRSRS